MDRVDDTGLAGDGLLQLVARIELHARRVGVDVQHNPRVWGFYVHSLLRPARTVHAFPSGSSEGQVRS